MLCFVCSQGVLDRFSQINPKILFSVLAVRYNGKLFELSEKLRAVAEGLPQIEKIVILPYLKEQENSSNSIQHISKRCCRLDVWCNCGEYEYTPYACSWSSCWLEEFLDGHSETDPEEYVQLPFDHPLFILYSSGTTGAPKCIVHSAGVWYCNVSHRQQCIVSPF